MSVTVSSVVLSVVSFLLLLGGCAWIPPPKFEYVSYACSRARQGLSLTSHKTYIHQQKYMTTIPA
jgi:hypothetical protein